LIGLVPLRLKGDYPKFFEIRGEIILPVHVNFSLAPKILLSLFLILKLCTFTYGFTNTFSFSNSMHVLWDVVLDLLSCQKAHLHWLD